MTNDQSLVEQARALLDKAFNDDLGLSMYASIDIANALLQLEQARQLKRIADYLNSIERALRKR